MDPSIRKQLQEIARARAAMPPVDVSKQMQEMARARAATPPVNVGEQLQEIARAKATIPPEYFRIGVTEALQAAEIGKASVAALSSYDMPSVLRASEELRKQNLAHIDSINEMIRQGAFRKVFEAMQDAPRRAIHNIVSGQHQSAREALISNIFNNSAAIQDIVRAASSGWLQDSLREARRVLSNPEIRSLFENLEDIEVLLEQAEPFEADAEEAEGELPETFDEQAFERLDTATLLFVVQYFNGVFTYIVIALMAACLGMDPESTLHTLNDGAQLAKLILIEAEKALQKKVGKEQDVE